MPVRIRLQRHGKKGKPFYWIVAADGRAKRDGRYLEKIGIYNPNTNPARVELNVDQAVKWLENGAQPSDTARTLLSYRGAMMRLHLNGGVKKGAFSQEEADKRFAAWLEEKEAKIQAKIDGLDKDKATNLAQRLEAEKAVNQKRISEMTAAPETEESEKGESAQATEVAQKESSTEEVAEAATTEEPKVEETPVEEPKSEDAPVEVVAEEPAVEEPVTEESSAEEPKAEEASIEEVQSEDAPDAKEEEAKD